MRITGGLSIIALYFPPARPRPTHTHLLQQLTSLMRGPSLALGDFNARHRSWDYATNPYGSTLYAWLNSHNISIHAPYSPTSIHHSGSAITDLFLSKATHVEIPRVAYGSWDIRTDHRLAYTSVTMTIPPVSAYLIKQASLQTKAKEFIRTQTPYLVSLFENATTPQDIITATKTMTHTILQPWAQRHRPKLKRAHNGWTTALDSLAAKRSTLLQLASNGQPEALPEANRLDKQIKRQYRQNKHRSLQEALVTPPTSNQGPLLINAVFTALNPNNKQSTPPTISADLFTTHVHNHRPTHPAITTTTFQTPPSFHNLIEQALHKLKPHKTPGPDALTSEVLQVTPTSSATLMMALWTAVGRLEYMPPTLTDGVLIPIYKTGDHLDPSNYRPIAIISHLRELLSTAVDTAIRQVYIFHDMQWGFTADRSTEQAILNATHCHRMGAAYYAVLDLSAAYDKVPRQSIVELATKYLPPHLAAMISALLAPNTFSTKGQKGHHRVTITTGVPQGDPASPELYNLFMDTFLTTMHDVAQHNIFPPVSCYADDVLLLARSASELQHLLDHATSWATQSGMSWNIKKCSILIPRPMNLSTDIYPPFKLHNQEIKCKFEAQYLGIPLTTGGPSDTATLTRLNKDTNLANMLLHSKLVHNPSYKARRQIVIGAIMPSVDYATHLTPTNAHLFSAAARCETKLAQWVLNIKPIPSRLPTIRLLAQIPPYQTRRIALAVRRLATLQQTLLAAPTPRSELQKIADSRRRRTLQQMLDSTHIYQLTDPHYDTLCQVTSTTNVKKMYNDIILRAWQGSNNTTRCIPINRSGIPIYNYNVPPQVQKFATLFYLNKLRVGMDKDITHDELSKLTTALCTGKLEGNTRNDTVALIRTIITRRRHQRQMACL